MPSLSMLGTPATLLVIVKLHDLTGSSVSPVVAPTDPVLKARSHVTGFLAGVLSYVAVTVALTSWLHALQSASKETSPPYSLALIVSLSTTAPW